MNDQNRTKILAGVLGLVLVFLFIKPQEWLMKPIRDAELELKRAQDDYERAEEKETELRIARGNIDEVNQYPDEQVREEKGADKYKSNPVHCSKWICERC